jgi:hypothetical protein
MAARVLPARSAAVSCSCASVTCAKAGEAISPSAKHAIASLQSLSICELSFLHLFFKKVIRKNCV